MGALGFALCSSSVAVLPPADDEMFSDAFKVKETDLFYEVEGKVSWMELIYIQTGGFLFTWLA